jgi:murein DD-endopeptidase MepM/ murein hydrolase activator NlpD
MKNKKGLTITSNFIIGFLLLIILIFFVTPAIGNFRNVANNGISTAEEKQCEAGNQISPDENPFMQSYVYCKDVEGYCDEEQIDKWQRGFYSLMKKLGEDPNNNEEPSITCKDLAEDETKEDCTCVEEGIEKILKQVRAEEKENNQEDTPDENNEGSSNEETSNIIDLKEGYDTFEELFQETSNTILIKHGISTAPGLEIILIYDPNSKKYVYGEKSSADSPIIIKEKIVLYGNDITTEYSDETEYFQRVLEIYEFNTQDPITNLQVYIKGEQTRGIEPLNAISENNMIIANREEIEIDESLFHLEEDLGSNRETEYEGEKYEFKLTSCFYRTSNINELHSGTDLVFYEKGNVNARNVPIPSLTDGEVVKINTGLGGGGFGRYVSIKSGDKYYFYAHLSEVSVNLGDQINFGDIIGIQGGSGNTENQYNVHLHFHISNDDFVSTSSENEDSTLFALNKIDELGTPLKSIDGDTCHNKEKVNMAKIIIDKYELS